MRMLRRGDNVREHYWAWKITGLTYEAQSVSWWFCLGGTRLWAHYLLSLAFAYQRNSKHPSYVSIRLFYKFRLYALVKRVDNMWWSKYWQVECPDCKELSKRLEIDYFSIWIIALSFFLLFINNSTIHIYTINIIYQNFL